MEHEQWLEWRRKGIGASDAPVIMGISPWRDIVELWEEKLGKREPQTDNWAMARGRELEPNARELYEQRTGLKMAPAFLESKTRDFMRCSFDGINQGQRGGIEIKCPGKESHELALSGKVPEHYLPQIYHQLSVGELAWVDYVSYDGHDSLAVVRVPRNEEKINELIAKEEKFWECVVTEVCPIPFYKDAEAALLDYREQQEVIDRCERRQETIKSYLQGIVKEPISCAGYSVGHKERAGNIDYKSVPDLDGIDLEKYRKPPTRYFEIRRNRK
jgi:putative phage-type endonuclease